ncbi:MAG: hydroxymethylbilane synthase [Verrucomicrobiota bacterium]|nr:hydroxymethylbilane synthase [Verrucomicrobiota bacterium]
MQPQAPQAAAPSAMPDRPIVVATRGSALALAQTNIVLGLCRAAFPKLRFELKIIKTTGDKLQRASMAQRAAPVSKGLFTKELEIALLRHQADMAVHSLKDLPTDLPAGLKLGAVPKRASHKDVLICRATDQSQSSQSDSVPKETASATPTNPICDPRILPHGSVVATSSTRRKAQLLEHRPDITIVDIRGNVVTRLEKLAASQEIHAIVLALAGLDRLNFKIRSDATLEGDAVPPRLSAFVIEPDILVPCVGQGAIGIEIRADDERIQSICDRIDHYNTRQCVLAERTFLHAMGGGCQSPVAAYAEVIDDRIHLRAVSYRSRHPRRAEGKRPVAEAIALGEQLAAEIS